MDCRVLYFLLCTTIRACLNVEACLSGTVSGNAACAAGYRGPLCAVCAEGYVVERAADRTCRRCTDSDVALTAALVALVAALVCQSDTVLPWDMDHLEFDPVFGGLVLVTGQRIRIVTVDGRVEVGDAVSRQKFHLVSRGPEVLRSWIHDRSFRSWLSQALRRPI